MNWNRAYGGWIITNAVALYVTQEIPLHLTRHRPRIRVIQQKKCVCFNSKAKLLSHKLGRVRREGGQQVEKEVSASKTGLGEGVKGYVEPQVSKKGLIITCMAGCYFYTGGWAAACLQQRLVEPFIRWSSDALPGALSLAGLLGWMQLLISS